MNIILFVALFITGVTGMLYEYKNKKTNYYIAGIFCILFVASAVSRVYRIDELRPYSDMAYYLRCYNQGDSSYFALGYRIISGLLYSLHCNEYILIGVIALLNIICIIAAYNRLACYRKKHNGSQDGFLSAFLSAYAMYWGFLFTTEIIRQGIALTICILTIAMMLNEEVIPSIITLAVGCLFHKSVLLALIILVLIRFGRADICRKKYLIWWGILILADLIFALARVNYGDPVNNLLSVVMHFISIWYAPANRILAYFSAQNAASSMFGYITTQYIFYNIVALWLMSGDMDDKLLNRSVLVYLTGLTFATLFRGFIAVIRIQWVFMTITAIAIFAYLSGKSSGWWNSKKVKYASVIMYCGWQSVMILRYFGMYII